MFPVNLYFLAKTNPLSISEFNYFYKSLSKSKRDLNVREKERQNLISLIEYLQSYNVPIEKLDGFFYSFSIDQISKEFDLLKIAENFTLNIEIKNEFTTIEKMQEQLCQNILYLKHLGKEIKSFTYIASNNSIFTLDEELRLVETNINELLQVINLCVDCYNLDLDFLFEPKHYLVSPFNNINKFINGEYFLTDHQIEIKKIICDSIRVNNLTTTFYKILGDAGTGKTLLIYDIAKKLSENYRICIIHCGIINQGQIVLNSELQNIDIISAKDFRINYDIINNYDVIIVDESQRIYKAEFFQLIELAKAQNKKVIFSIGIDQLIQYSEIRNNINAEIDALENLSNFSLTKKIRTNINMASFINNIVNLANKNPKADYSEFDVFYAQNKEEALKTLKYLISKDYYYISFTTSLFNRNEIDEFANELNTHKVIGQEFDNVAMILGQNFEYDNNRLSSRTHPNPDYIFSKLFYQGITRARLKLSIIVLRNPALYKKIIEVKENKGE